MLRHEMFSDTVRHSSGSRPGVVNPDAGRKINGKGRKESFIRVRLSPFVLWMTRRI